MSLSRVAQIGPWDVRCTPADERPYWLTRRATGNLAKADGKPLEFATQAAAEAWAREHSGPKVAP